MHLEVRQYLSDLAAAYANDPLGYLWEFAPVHSWWHMERMNGTQPVGFLTFHRLVIRSLRQTFPGGRIPVQATSPVPFPSQLDLAANNVNSVGAMQEFSADLEGWHNGVHNSLGGAFADPQRNVYLRTFWEFHIFLDAKFANAPSAWGITWSSYVNQISEADQRTI